jgi:hypothetical protein
MGLEEEKEGAEGILEFREGGYIDFRHIATYFEINDRKTLFVLRMNNYGKRIWKETNSLRA